MSMRANKPAVASVGFAVAAGGANVSEMTITLKDASGAAIAGARSIEIYLSDSATGLGITGTTASGTVTAKSASGTVLTALTAKKHIIVTTLATGVFVLEITDTAKSLFVVCVKVPEVPAIQCATALITGNYG